MFDNDKKTSSEITSEERICMLEMLTVFSRAMFSAIGNGEFDRLDDVMDSASSAVKVIDHYMGEEPPEEFAQMIVDAIRKQYKDNTGESYKEKTRFRIWNFERGMWWKQIQYGYTSDFKEAGQFTASKAIEICINANHGDTTNEAMIPVKDK